jgi:hypothetical protein
MMRKIALVALILFFPFTSGICGQDTWPPDYRARVTNRVFKADYDTVFNSVIECMENNAFPVVVQNRSTGILATDYVAKPGIFAGKGQLRLDFLVRKVDEQSTNVRLNIKCQTYSNVAGALNVDNYIDEGNYEDFFKAIDNEIKKALKAKQQQQDTGNSSGPNPSPYAFPVKNPDSGSIFRTSL